MEREGMWGEGLEEEGVPGAVSVLGNVTGANEDGTGEVRTKSGMMEDTRFSLAIR
jgi:hypothetical protein